jgi:hypothetical protein
MDQEKSSSLFGLTIDLNSKTHLAEAARWGKFLAIVGFVMCVLTVLMGIFFSSFFSWMSDSQSGAFESAQVQGLGVMMAVFYIIGALLLFFPCLFLYRFSVNMKSALTSNDQDRLNKSFQNLKIMLRYYGIITIIILAFYAIAIIFGVLGQALA